MIKPKPNTNLEEGVRLAFNHLRLIDATKSNNGYKWLEERLNAENELRNWLHCNLDGLPQPEIEENKKDQH